jgi:hypothetical protein
MARIPVYQERQSVGQPMGVRQVSAPNVDAGFIGRSMQQVGTALGQMAQAQLNVEEENAKAWAANASASSALQWTQRLKEMQESTEPGARNFTSNLAKEFDPWADETIKSAPDRASKKFLQQSLVALRQNVLSNAIAFEATEGRNHRFSLVQDGITKAAQVVYTDPTEMNLSQLMGEQEAIIDSMNDTPTRKSQLRQSLRTAMGRAGAEAMARDMPQVLTAQIAAAKKAGKKSSGNAFLDLLSPTEWSTYEELAKNNADMGNARVMANSAFRNFVKNDDDPVSLDKMRQFLDDNNPGISEKERDVAYKLLDDLARTHNYSAKERSVSRQSNVIDIGLSRGLATMQASSEFKALRPAEQADILGKVANYNKKSATDADWDAYLSYISDPVALGNMSPQEVNVIAAGLGGDLGRKLKEQRAKLASNADVLNAKIDNDTFNAMLPRFGLNPTKKGDRVKIAMVRDRVEEALTLRAQRKQAPLTIEEKRQEIELIAKDTVRQGWFFKDDVPRVTLQTEDQRKTSVLYGGVEVKIGDIPPRIIQATDAAFRRIKRVPTAQDYVQQWIEEGRPKQ